MTGKLYKNKSLSYLYPCLKGHGDSILDQIGRINLVCVGIRDYNVKEDKDCLYLLISSKSSIGSSYVNSQVYANRFNTFLKDIRLKDYYVRDYIYSNVDKNPYHMVVLRIPEKHKGIMQKFKEGRYSEMYTLEEIDEYFKVPISYTSKRVLKKDETYLPIFVAIVNSEFNTDATVEDFKDAELDYPPDLRMEIFNYKIN